MGGYVAGYNAWDHYMCGGHSASSGRQQRLGLECINRCKNCTPTWDYEAKNTTEKVTPLQYQ